jgi:hypothetical protein
MRQLRRAAHTLSFSLAIERNRGALRAGFLATETSICVDVTDPPDARALLLLEDAPLFHRRSLRSKGNLAALATTIKNTPPTDTPISHLGNQRKEIQEDRRFRS